MRADEILLESQDYNGMFNPLLGFMQYDQLKDRYVSAFENEITWAREVLRRKDRIIWWLRLARLSLALELLDEEWMKTQYYGEPHEDHHIVTDESREKLEQLVARWTKESNLAQSSIKNSHFLTSYRSQLTHYMGIPAPDIQNTVFDKQAPDSLFARFDAIQAVWQKSREQEVEPEGDVVISFPDGWAWYKLDRASCDKEGDAMGHCGNLFGEPSDRLLSLRRRLKNGMDRPSLTFILDVNGFLGEMKGRANNKPDAKYHPYIVALLKNPAINGIKGGGYDPRNNFEMKDLSAAERDSVYETKPELMTCSDYHAKFGVDGTLRNMMLKKLEGSEAPMPLGLVDNDGVTVFAHSVYSHWQEGLIEHGDESIEQLINADWEFWHDDQEDLVENFLDGLPEMVADKVVEYAEKDRTGEDSPDLDNIDYDEIYEYIEEEMGDLHMLIQDANIHGKEVGTQREVEKALRSACDDFGVFQLDHESDSGKYYLWCSVAKACEMIDDLDSAIYTDDGIFEERPSVSNELDQYVDFDADAANQYFIENCPDDIEFSIPAMKPVNEMTLEEIRSELHELGKDDQWIKTYYGGIFEKHIGEGLLRVRKRLYGVEENIPVTEAHHEYDDADGLFAPFAPLKSSDVVRVFHGFREPTEAIRTAKLGLSGASRISRVYSYEADNNPKGLFVTMSRNTAAQFVGAFGTHTIMEFNARVSELEAPVWPSGNYTVQGEYAQYFGRGPEGRRNRSAARKEQSKNITTPEGDEFAHVHASDDPMLAKSLTVSYEKQALFMGHLSPEHITCFWVEQERGSWKRFTVDQYLAEFAESYPEKDVMKDHHSKAFLAGEEFDGEKFLTALKEIGGQQVDDTMARLWKDVVKAPQQSRARTFLGYFELYLWPKQYIPAMQWMRDRYGRNIAE